MSSRVERLRGIIASREVDHKQMIIKEPTLKDVHIYCLMNQLSSQMFGRLIEDYIIRKFGFVTEGSKNGDCQRNGEKFEIKVSMGGKTNDTFNFVQLRPFHGVDWYIFTAYHLSLENLDSEGELYIFKISSKELNKLILDHGRLAHGRKQELGKITQRSIRSGTTEFALRPRMNDRCWNELIKFRITESDL